MGNAHEFRLCAVDGVAQNPAAGGAMRKHALAAKFALSAGADARDQDPVAGLEGSHRRANAVNHADAFMAENAPRRATRQIAFEDVQVGAANGRPGDPDDGIAGRDDLRLRVVFKGLLARSMIDQSFHRRLWCDRIHRGNPCACRPEKGAPTRHRLGMSLIVGDLKHRKLRIELRQIDESTPHHLPAPARLIAAARVLTRSAPAKRGCVRASISQTGRGISHKITRAPRSRARRTTVSRT